MATLPRVNKSATNTSAPHRYPTRQQNACPHAAHHVATIDNTALHGALPPPTPRHYAHYVVDPDTRTAMEYRHLIQQPDKKKAWEHSLTSELGRLAQGIKDRVKDRDTIFFTA